MARKEAGFERKPARYAKKMVAIICVSDGSGLKTRAMRLAALLANDRYSHREHAYLMSARRADLFEKLFNSDYDACYIEKFLETPDGKEITVTQYERSLRK